MIGLPERLGAADFGPIGKKRARAGFRRFPRAPHAPIGRNRINNDRLCNRKAGQTGRARINRLLQRNQEVLRYSCFEGIRRKIEQLFRVLRAKAAA